MSEMLANHYFMTRNFYEACNLYEKLYSPISIPISVQKKLIICYIYTRQLKKALLEFYKIINTDIKAILNSSVDNEDCPCPEIIPQIQNGKIYIDEDEKDLSLGILWLYCDIIKSEYFFLQYQKHHPNDKLINQIIEIINQQITNQKIKGEKA